MTSSSDIAAKFEAPIKAFTPIVVQLKDNDLQRVRKFLLQTCLSICLAGLKAGKFTGLVLSDAAYKNQPGVTISFDEDGTPLDEYNPSVTRETKAWEQRKLQALWNIRLNNQDRISTTKHGCRLFILHAFDEVHYISLRDEDTYHKMVSLIEFLAHFSKEIGVLKVTNVVTLIGKLPGYWTRNPQVPQFIMTMEEAQKKSQHAGFPITDNWIAAFATSSLLVVNYFTSNHLEWDGKPKAKQTWRSWKDTFKPLYKNLERKTRLTREKIHSERRPPPNWSTTYSP